MSYYHNYYMCYKENGKIYPYAPFTVEGEFKPILVKSRSFASDLHQSFNIMSEEYISDELRKEFEYKDWDDSKKIQPLKYISIDKIPELNPVKKGYCLIDDIQAWEKCGDDSIFDGMINANEYARKLEHQIMFGKNEPIKDTEGCEYNEPNASDYTYYADIQYASKEYECWIIHNAVDMLYEYDFFSYTCREVVIVESEG